MPGLSNDYIEKLMFKLSINPQKFKGIKPCDIFLTEVKNKINIFEEGDCFIINMSSSNNAGSDFISIFVSSPNKAEYFDSFGLPSFDSNINAAIQAAKLKVTEFDKAIQDLSSQFCGLYCIAYLIWRQIGLEKQNFARLFNYNFKALNDGIVLNLLKVYIKEKRTLYKAD